MRLALRIGHQRRAQALAEELTKRYNFVEQELVLLKPKAKGDLDKPLSDDMSQKADVIVVVGGDGFMLSQLRRAIEGPTCIPHFGLSVGSTGFLLNTPQIDNLIERINAAQCIRLPVIEAKAHHTDGEISTHRAINEVALLRKSPQTAHLRITVDGVLRLARLVADGVILSTPTGSTGYNSSLHGPILPLESSIMALTPISPFRPRRWRGALLPQSVSVSIEVSRTKKRPAFLTVDNKWVGSIERVDMCIIKDQHVQLLFDANAHLQDRMIKEQFAA